MTSGDHTNSKHDFKNAIYEKEAAERKASRFETVFKIYGGLGFLATVLGGAYFAINTFDYELNDGQRSGLLVSLTGLIIGVFSYLALSIIKQRRNVSVKRNEYRQYLWEFLESWIDFEKSSREAILSRDKSFSSNSIRHVIEELGSYGLIDRDDSSELLDAMRVRNAMLHGGDEVPAHVVRNYSEFLLGIKHKIGSR